MYNKNKNYNMFIYIVENNTCYCELIRKLHREQLHLVIQVINFQIILNMPLNYPKHPPCVSISNISQVLVILSELSSK